MKELKEVPTNITLDDFCKHCMEFDAISKEALINLQKQLVLRLPEKEKRDFFVYIYKTSHNYIAKSIKRPSVWVKIWKCLPLLWLFVIACWGHPEIQALVKKYKKGDLSVLELPFGKDIYTDEISSKENWSLDDYYFHYNYKNKEK